MFAAGVVHDHMHALSLPLSPCVVWRFLNYPAGCILDINDA
jgi:hypothetical protein